MGKAHSLNIVGRQVAKLRYERGLSQSDFAVACQLKGWEVTREIIAKIEGGFRCVQDSEVILLARMLKAPVAALFPLEDQCYFEREDCREEGKT